MANFRFDLLNSTVSELPEMIEIIRPCYVSNITLVNSPLSDPRALTRIRTDPNCPQGGSPDPEPFYAAIGVILRGYRIRNAGGDPTKAILDLVYRGPPQGSAPSNGANLWTLTDFTHTQVDQSYMTAGGAKNISLYYQKGWAGNAGMSPANPDGTNVVAGRRFRAIRGLRVTGLLTAAQWLPMAPTIMALRARINSQQWGPVTAHSRGTWYFEGPTTKTQDFGVTYFVELSFLNDPLGFYDLFTFKQKSTGLPPVDIDTEAFLRAQGLPAVGGLVQANGLALASMQFEGNFSIFNFFPVY